MILLRVLAGVFACCVLAYGSPPQAVAADIPDGCWNQELKISWPGDFPNSYPDYLLNDAKAGAEFWSSRRDLLGSGRLIPVAHGYSILSANAKVEWTGVLTDETYGVAVCSESFSSTLTMKMISTAPTA